MTLNQKIFLFKLAIAVLMIYHGLDHIIYNDHSTTGLSQWILSSKLSNSNMVFIILGSIETVLGLWLISNWREHIASYLISFLVLIEFLLLPFSFERLSLVLVVFSLSMFCIPSRLDFNYVR